MPLHSEHFVWASETKADLITYQAHPMRAGRGYIDSSF